MPSLEIFHRIRLEGEQQYQKFIEDQERLKRSVESTDISIDDLEAAFKRLGSSVPAAAVDSARAVFERLNEEGATTSKILRAISSELGGGFADSLKVALGQLDSYASELITKLTAVEKQVQGLERAAERGGAGSPIERLLVDQRYAVSKATATGAQPEQIARIGGAFEQMGQTEILKETAREEAEVYREMELMERERSQQLEEMSRARTATLKLEALETKEALKETEEAWRAYDSEVAGTNRELDLMDRERAQQTEEMSRARTAAMKMESQETKEALKATENAWKEHESVMNALAREEEARIGRLAQSQERAYNQQQAAAERANERAQQFTRQQGIAAAPSPYERERLRGEGTLSDLRAGGAGAEEIGEAEAALASRLAGESRVPFGFRPPSVRGSQVLRGAYMTGGMFLPGRTGAAAYGAGMLAESGIFGEGALAGEGLAGMTLGGTLAVGGGIAAGVGVAAMGVHEAGEAGKAALEQRNLAIQTGLTITQLGLLKAAATENGVSIGALATGMRTLAEGEEEAEGRGAKIAAELESIGVKTKDSAGNVRPMYDQLIDLSKALSGLDDLAARDVLDRVLGRGGRELLPAFKQDLGAVTEEMKRLGIAFSEDGARSALQYEEQLKRLETQWESLKKSFGEKAIGIIQVLEGGDNGKEGLGNLLGRGLMSASGFVASGGITSAVNDFTGGVGTTYNNLKGMRQAGQFDLFDNDNLREQEIRRQMGGLGNAPVGMSAADAANTGARLSYTQAQGKTLEGLERQRAAVQSRFSTFDEAARGPHGTAADVKLAEQAEKDLQDVNAKIKELRDAKKPGRGEHGVELELDRELMRLKEGELFGEQKINQVYADRLVLLERQNQATGHNKDLVEQMRVVAVQHYQEEVTRNNSNVSGQTLRAATRGQIGLNRARLSAQLEDMGTDSQDGLDERASLRQKIADQDFQLSVYSVGEQAAEFARIPRTDLLRRGTALGGLRQAANNALTQRSIQQEGITRANARESNALDVTTDNNTRQGLNDKFEDQRNRMDNVLTNLDKITGVQGDRRDVALSGSLGRSSGLFGEAAQADLERRRVESVYGSQMYRVSQERQLNERQRTGAVDSGVYSEEQLKKFDDVRRQLDEKAINYQVEAYTKLYDIRSEQEKKIADYRNQRIEAVGNVAGEFFGALTGGHANTAVPKFFEGQALGIGKTIFENLAKDVFSKTGDMGISGLIKGQTEADPNHPGASRLTTIGKLLQGTPFGVHQENVMGMKVDRTNTLLEEIKAALQANLEKLRSGAGMDGREYYPGGGGGGGSSLPMSAVRSFLPNVGLPSTYRGGGSGTSSPAAVAERGGKFMGSAVGHGYTRLPSGLLAESTGVGSGMGFGMGFGAGAAADIALSMGMGLGMEGGGGDGTDGDYSRPVSSMGIPGQLQPSSVSSNISFGDGFGDTAYSDAGYTSGASGASRYGSLGLSSSLSMHPDAAAQGASDGIVSGLSGPPDLGVNVPGLSQRTIDAVQTKLPDLGGGGKFSSGGYWGNTVEGGMINYANGTGSGLNAVGSGLATGLAVYGGVRGVMAGIHQGGAYGTLGAVGSAAATAAALDPEPVSKAALEIAAMSTKIIQAIMGDPRQRRAAQLTKELQTNAFLPLASEDRSQDLNGNYSGFDKYGRLITTSAMDMPSISSPYVKKIDGNYIPFPSVVLSPYSQGNTTNINAIDSQSLTNYLTQNPNAVNAGIATAMSVPGKAQNMINDSVGVGFGG